MMFGVIYCITNAINGKQYVGQTTLTPAKRWWWHLKYARDGSRSALHCAIRKYGKGAFVVGQIDSANSKEELSEKEIFHIAALKTIAPAGYNLTAGGEGMSGWSPTEETRRKRSESLRGHLVSEETCHKISATLRGHAVSVETRQKIAEKIRNNAVGNYSPFRRKKRKEK
jgi:group I intron endonuclease